MRAMILARELRIHEAQTAEMAAATPVEVTPEVATRVAVAATQAAATRVGATPVEVTLAVEDPAVDKMRAGGTRRMTKGYRS
jgi:hypothetical protein